jgi:hypothetical protein
MSKNLFVRRSSALLSVAAMATTGLVAAAVPAGAAITTGGAEDANGRPAFVRDANGIALAFCDDTVNCEPADPADPLHGGYFGAEATAGGITAIFGIETAAGEDAAGEPTDQATIANVARFRGEGLQPGGRYTIKHPWGTRTVFADGQGDLDVVVEAGGEAATPLGSGVVTTFLRRLNAPAGFLGDLETAGPVTGSPTGFNALRVTGPAVSQTVRAFTVNGQMRANTAMTSVDTKALNLGSITKSTPSTVTIPVSSFGTAAANLTITKAGANPGAFSLPQGASLTVPQGTTRNIQVRYTPQANRDVAAVLVVDDAGDLTAPRRIVVNGTAHDTRAPKVESRTPAKGSTVRSGTNVKVKFTEAVSGFKSGLSLVDASGDKVAARVSRVAKTSNYVLNPRRSLDGGRYTVKVNGGANGIRDLAGNAAKDVSWSFRSR